MKVREVKPKAELIAYTPEPEKTVALAAKLCYSDADIACIKAGVEERDTTGYIRMLVKLGHFSPIEHASFTFGIEGVSRALLAQITRHRIASFSVKSQRYVGLDETMNYVLPPAIRALGADAVAEFEREMAQTAEWYKAWQERLGGAGEKSNEDARFVLPNASETKMIVTMNARELIHFFALRCCNRAQWEIRDIAWQMLELVLPIAPTLFENCGPSCLKGKCGEGKMTCGDPEGVRAHYEAVAASCK